MSAYAHFDGHGLVFGLWDRCKGCLRLYSCSSMSGTDRLIGGVGRSVRRLVSYCYPAIGRSNFTSCLEWMGVTR